MYVYTYDITELWRVGLVSVGFVSRLVCCRRGRRRGRREKEEEEGGTDY